MDEDGTVLVYLLQVDDEFCGIMLGVCENFCTKEGDDMIRDYWDGLVAEVSVVDTQLGVKPGDLVRDEFSGDKTLRMGFHQDWVCGSELRENIAYLGRDLGLNLSPLFLLAFEDGGDITGEILQLADGRIAIATRDPCGRCGHL